MKNKGKIFEEQFKKSAQQEGIFIHRIRDNAMSYVESESTFTHKNMCDFLVYKMPYLYAFELKHTTYPSIGIQTSPNEDIKMIQYEQIRLMNDASQYEGVVAGLILSFENTKIETESTFFIEINRFIDFLTETKKKSINMIDIAKYGGIRLKQQKKRINYHYEIQNLLSQINQKEGCTWVDKPIG